MTFNVTNIGSCSLKLRTKLYNKQPLGAEPILHTEKGGYFSPIQIFVSSSMVSLGENVNITGFTVPAQSGINVTIQYRHENGANWYTLENLTTNELGGYRYEWAPSKSGTYEVRATATVENTEVESVSLPITVKALEQSLWPYIIITIIVFLIIVMAIAYHRRLKKSKRKKL